MLCHQGCGNSERLDATSKLLGEKTAALDALKKKQLEYDLTMKKQNTTIQELTANCSGLTLPSRRHRLYDRLSKESKTVAEKNRAIAEDDAKAASLAEKKRLETKISELELQVKQLKADRKQDEDGVKRARTEVKDHVVVEKNLHETLRNYDGLIQKYKKENDELIKREERTVQTLNRLTRLLTPLMLKVTRANLATAAMKEWMQHVYYSPDLNFHDLDALFDKRQEDIVDDLEQALGGRNPDGMRVTGPSADALRGSIEKFVAATETASRIRAIPHQRIDTVQRQADEIDSLKDAMAKTQADLKAWTPEPLQSIVVEGPRQEVPKEEEAPYKEADVGRAGRTGSAREKEALSMEHGAPGAKEEAPAPAATAAVTAVTAAVTKTAVTAVTTQPARALEPEERELAAAQKYNCQAWSKGGECDKNPRYMCVQCKQDCPPEKYDVCRDAADIAKAKESGEAVQPPQTSPVNYDYKNTGKGPEKGGKKGVARITRSAKPK